MGWIRANGGTISELVGVSVADGQRSIVALGHIPSQTKLVSIPPKLQLIPEVVTHDHDLPRRVAKVKDTAFRDAAFGAHIVREVERRKKAREAGEEGDGGVFFAPFWDSIEGHLALVQGPDFWQPEDQAMLGREAVRELNNYKEMYDDTHEAIVKHFKRMCAMKALADCESILGDFDESQFIKALLMHWSRRFNDGGQGVLPPFVINMNHRLPRISNVNFELTEGVFGATSKRDIAKGEELTITYGNWHNDEMLKVYGFTQPPVLEPSFFFQVYQEHAREVVPHLVNRDPEATFDLPTPYLVEEEEQSDWVESLETLSPLLDFYAGAAGFADLDAIVDFYAAELAALPLIAPFVAELHSNRLQNRSSHVWWAANGDAEVADKSSAEALGNARRSDAVRMRMCHFLALTVWQEALLLSKGKMEAGDALPVAVALVPHLKAALEGARNRDSDGYDSDDVDFDDDDEDEEL